MPSNRTRPAGPGLWSRLGTVMPVLNPVLLLVVGYFLNAGISNANVEIARQKASIDQLKASAETDSLYLKGQVDKAKVISDFLNDLTGKDEMRRQVAVQAIQIVLPSDEAGRILEAVKRSAPADSKLATDVTAGLAQVQSDLVNGMFSEEKSTRVAALRALKKSGLDDQALIRQLLERVNQDVRARAEIQFPDPPRGGLDEQRHASIYNTAEFLSFAKVSDAATKQKIREFADAAQANSKDTRRVAEMLKTRFK